MFIYLNDVFDRAAGQIEMAFAIPGCYLNYIFIILISRDTK